MTQNVYAQNIGNLGNMSDSSSVTNNLSNNKYSFNELDQYIKQIAECIPALPPDARHLVQAEIGKIDEHKKSNNHSAIKASLSSIKSICEKITTSLAAQGIVSMLKSILCT